VKLSVFVAPIVLSLLLYCNITIRNLLEKGKIYAL